MARAAFDLFLEVTSFNTEYDTAKIRARLSLSFLIQSLFLIFFSNSLYSRGHKVTFTSMKTSMTPP